MNARLEQEFLDKYPEVLKDVGTLDVGDGWRDLVTVVCHYLELVNMVHGANFRVAQLKEKFAGLRVYVECGEDVHQDIWEAVYRALKMVEDLSLKTCEDCGADGVPRSGGWARTLCDDHSMGKPPLKKVIDNVKC